MSVNKPLEEDLARTEQGVQIQKTSSRSENENLELESKKVPKSINPLKEHLKNIQIETGTRATFQNKKDTPGNDKSETDQESRPQKRKRKERTSNPHCQTFGSAEKLNSRNLTVKDINIIDQTNELVTYQENLDPQEDHINYNKEAYDSNSLPKTKLNYDYSNSGYKFREYKAPIVSFLDDEDYYGGDEQNQGQNEYNLGQKYRIQGTYTPLTLQQQQHHSKQFIIDDPNNSNSNSSNSNSNQRFTGTTYCSKDISTILEVSQECSELNQSSTEQLLNSSLANSANKYETPKLNSSNQQKLTLEQLRQLQSLPGGMKLVNQYQQLSPVMEHRSAEDKYDSTGYIFHSRIGAGSTFTNNMDVLEFQRSQPTSFDPISIENTESELSKIRKRRATLGANDQSVNSEHDQKVPIHSHKKKTQSNILGSFEESDGGITPSNLSSAHERDRRVKTLREQSNVDNSYNVNSPISVHVKKSLPSVINSKTDRESPKNTENTDRLENSTQFRLNLQRTDRSNSNQNSKSAHSPELQQTMMQDNLAMKNVQQKLIFKTEDEIELREKQSPGIQIEPDTIELIERTPTLELTEDIDAAIFDSLQPEDKEKDYGDVETSWRRYQERETTDFCAEQSDSDMKNSSLLTSSQKPENFFKEPSTNSIKKHKEGRMYLSGLSKIQISYPPAVETVKSSDNKHINHSYHYDIGPDEEPNHEYYEQYDVIEELPESTQRHQSMKTSSLLLPPSTNRIRSRTQSNRTMIQSTITSINIESSPNPTLQESRLNTIDISTSRLSSPISPQKFKTYDSKTSAETIEKYDKYNDYGRYYSGGEENMKKFREHYHDNYEDKNNSLQPLGLGYNVNNVHYETNSSADIEYCSYDIQNYQTFGGNQSRKSVGMDKGGGIVQNINVAKRKSTGPYIPPLDIKNNVHKKNKEQLPAGIIGNNGVTQVNGGSISNENQNYNGSENSKISLRALRLMKQSIQSIDITPRKMRTVATAFSRNFIAKRNRQLLISQKLPKQSSPEIKTITQPQKENHFEAANQPNTNLSLMSHNSNDFECSNSKRNKWQERKLLNSKRNTLDSIEASKIQKAIFSSQKTNSKVPTKKNNTFSSSKTNPIPQKPQIQPSFKEIYQPRQNIGIFSMNTFNTANINPVITSSPQSQSKKVFQRLQTLQSRESSLNNSSAKNSLIHIRSKNGNFRSQIGGSVMGDRSRSGSILSKKYTLNNSQIIGKSANHSVKKVKNKKSTLNSHDLFATNIFNANFVQNPQAQVQKKYISSRRGALNLLSSAKEVESRSITPQNNKYMDKFTPNITPNQISKERVQRNITPKGPIFHSKTSEVNLSQIAQNLLLEYEEKDKSASRSPLKFQPTKVISQKPSSKTLVTALQSPSDLREFPSLSSTINCQSSGFFNQFNQKISQLTDDDSNGYTCVRLDSELTSTNPDLGRSINHRLNMEQEIDKSDDNQQLNRTLMREHFYENGTFFKNTSPKRTNNLHTFRIGSPEFKKFKEYQKTEPKPIFTKTLELKKNAKNKFGGKNLRTPKEHKGGKAQLIESNCRNIESIKVTDSPTVKYKKYSKPLEVTLAGGNLFNKQPTRHSLTKTQNTTPKISIVANKTSSKRNISPLMYRRTLRNNNPVVTSQIDLKRKVTPQNNSSRGNIIHIMNRVTPNTSSLKNASKIQKEIQPKKGSSKVIEVNTGRKNILSHRLSPKGQTRSSINKNEYQSVKTSNSKPIRKYAVPQKMQSAINNERTDSLNQASRRNLQPRVPEQKLGLFSRQVVIDQVASSRNPSTVYRSLSKRIEHHVERNPSVKSYRSPTNRSLLRKVPSSKQIETFHTLKITGENRSISTNLLSVKHSQEVSHRSISSSKNSLLTSKNVIINSNIQQSSQRFTSSRSNINGVKYTDSSVRRIGIGVPHTQELKENISARINGAYPRNQIIIESSLRRNLKNRDIERGLFTLRNNQGEIGNRRGFQI